MNSEQLMTDEEIESIFQAVANDDPGVHMRFARAIIAAVYPAPPAPVGADDGYVYLRVKRPEGYEDVHPDLVLEDMRIHDGFEVEALATHPPAPAGDAVREALEKDAARYWWLRENSPCLILENIFGCEARRHPQLELDRAIDAALSTTKD